MIRITLLEISLLAAPFLLYFIYRALVARSRAGAPDGTVNETPYQVLFLAGSAVALASLVTVVLLGRDEERGQATRDQVYIPPRVVDGEVVPGQFLSREEAISRGLVEESAHPDPEADLLGETPDARAP